MFWQDFTTNSTSKCTFKMAVIVHMAGAQVIDELFVGLLSVILYLEVDNHFWADCCFRELFRSTSHQYTKCYSLKYEIISSGQHSDVLKSWQSFIFIVTVTNNVRKIFELPNMVTGPATQVMTFGFSLFSAPQDHYLHLSLDSINHQLECSSVSIKSDLHQFVTINSTFRYPMHHQCITDCHHTMQLNWNLLENHAITEFWLQTLNILGKNFEKSKHLQIFCLRFPCFGPAKNM